MKSIISMLSVLMLSLVFVACSSTGQATGLGTDATNEVTVLVADAINEANALKDAENAIQYANFEVQIEEILARIEEEHGDHDDHDKHGDEDKHAHHEEGHGEGLEEEIHHLHEMLEGLMELIATSETYEAVHEAVHESMEHEGEHHEDEEDKHAHDDEEGHDEELEEELHHLHEELEGLMELIATSESYEDLHEAVASMEAE
ncbi:MAG: hypothetical protein CL795_02205 [Chloroflexi bacterium]|nr:hypothetical protein [Chloroflexota bacterium]